MIQRKGGRPAEGSRRVGPSAIVAKRKSSRRGGKGLFGLPAAQNWWGVATVVATMEAEGRQRRVRVGGIERLYQRPAQRPRHKLVQAVADEDLAKLLSGFGHPHRVAIVKAIYAGAGTYRELRKKVPLKAGPMYHHLRELRLAGVLADGPRDVYRLTPRGRDAVMVVCSIGTLKDAEVT
jgi:DNA-binding HxlR family transcriptional regulator